MSSSQSKQPPRHRYNHLIGRVLQTFLVLLGLGMMTLELSALVAFGGSTSWTWGIGLATTATSLLVGWLLARVRLLRGWFAGVLLLLLWAAQPLILHWLQRGWAQLVIAPERSTLLYAQALVRTAILTIGCWGCWWICAIKGIQQWQRYLRWGYLLLGVGCVIHLSRTDLSGASGAFGLLTNRDSGYAAKPTAQPLEEYGRITFASDGRPLVMERYQVTSRVLQAAIPLLVRPRAGSGLLSGDYATIYRDIFYSQLSAQKGDDGYEIILHRTRPAWKWPGGGDPDLSQLAPNGLLAIYYDARALDAPALAREVLRWQKEFPQAQLWSTGANDYLLLLSKVPFDLPLGNMVVRFAEPSLVRPLTACGIYALPKVFGAYLLGGEVLTSWAKSYATSAPQRSLPLVFDREQGLRILKTIPPSEGAQLTWLKSGAGLDDEVYASLIERAELFAGKAHQQAIQTRLSDGSKFEQQLNPEDPLILELVDRLSLEAGRRQKLGDIPGAVKARESILTLGIDTADAHCYYALALRAKANTEGALRHFLIAADKDPNRLDLQLAAAHSAEAAKQYRLALRLWKELAQRFGRNEPSIRDRSDMAQARVWAADWEGRNPEEALRLALAVCERDGWQSKAYSSDYADICILCGRAIEGVKIKQRIRQGEK